MTTAMRGGWPICSGWGVLPEGYIYPKEERAVRGLLRKWGQLVHQRTANLRSIQSLMSRTTGNSISAQYIKALMGDWCGPTVQHQLMKTGARQSGITHPRGLKKRIEKFSQERLCLLTCQLPENRE
jgi:hypothetical protein